MADTTLYLGDFQFTGMEIPERIPLGGSQAMVVHKFPGGARAVRTMGRDDAPIDWSGIFTGHTALERARYLDTLRVQGNALPLTFFDFSLSVVIRSFRFNVEKAYRVTFTIELEVVKDFTQPQDNFPLSDFDTPIEEDSADAQELGDEVGDSTLSDLLDTMDEAIKEVSDFAKATQETINSVMAPVNAVLSRVNTLIASATNTINNVTTLGGILPNNPISQQAASLLGQVTAFTQSSTLYNLQSVVGRISSNLNLINNGPNVRTVAVGSGTLYDVAATECGDPEKWTAIAQANKVVDPQISGITFLTIPNNPPDTGGVFTK